MSKKQALDEQQKISKVLNNIKDEIEKKCYINYATDGWVINEEDVVSILDKYINGKGKDENR